MNSTPTEAHNTLSARLPIDVVVELDAIARDRGETRSAVIRRALALELARMRRQLPPSVRRPW